VFWARMTKGKASSFCHQENINIILLRLQFQNVPRIPEQSRRLIKHSSFVTCHELVTTFTWLYTQIAKIAEQRTTVPKGRTLAQYSRICKTRIETLCPSRSRRSLCMLIPTPVTGRLEGPWSSSM